MRPRTWGAIACAVTAFGLGFVPVDAVQQVAGFFWLAAIILAIASLPFWAKVLPEVPPMAGLFRKVGDDQRWCALCGTPADKTAACGVCGGEPKVHAEKTPATKANKPQKP